MHSIRPSGCFWLLVVVGLVLRLWPFSVGGWLYFLSLQWKFLSFVSKKNKKLSDVDVQPGTGFTAYTPRFRNL
jgi:hypothetical protein